MIDQSTVLLCSTIMKIDDCWVDLGARLATLNPRKFDEMMEALKAIVEAQELLARFDWQLFMRGRPTKRYRA